MSKPDYVYVTAIAAPPKTVWNGLTTPEFTRQYWHGTHIESDFTEDSPITFTKDGDIVCEGRILVADFPSRLAYTWHFPRNPETSSEAPSRVTFLLEAIEQGTRLTVIHDQFEPDSKTYDMVRNGWPLVIAGLKTLLESGNAVDFSTAGQLTAADRPGRGPDEETTR